MDIHLIIMGCSLIVLLCFSAFLSASEMAFTSLNPIRIKMDADNDNKSAQRVLLLMNNYNLTITSIVVGNNIVNILLPTIATLFFTMLIPDPNLAIFISTIVMSIIVIFCGEIIPKIYGNQQQEQLMYKIINILYVLIKLLYIITSFFLIVTNFIQRKFFPKEDQEADVLIEDEILTRIGEGLEAGQINENEETLIRNAVEFDDIKVGEILQPKANIITINVDDNIDDIYKLMLEQRYSRYPVYEKDSDNIIGLLYERDFLEQYINHKTVDIKTILREVIFIPDTMRISVLLTQLQKNRLHLVIVVDEYGTIQGLLTFEDIIEQLVGEIWDEHDDVLESIKQINPNTYLLDGAYSINDFNDYFEKKTNVLLTSEEENTIAGFIIEQLQSLPQVGQQVKSECYTFIIKSINNNRIAEIELKVKEQV